MKLVNLLAFAFPALILGAVVAKPPAKPGKEGPIKPTKEGPGKPVEGGPAKPVEEGIFIYDADGKLVRKVRPANAEFVNIGADAGLSSSGDTSPVDSGPSIMVHGCWPNKPTRWRLGLQYDNEQGCNYLARNIRDQGGLPPYGRIVHYYRSDSGWDIRRLINRMNFWIGVEYWVCMNELTWIVNSCPHPTRRDEIYSGWTQTGNNWLRTEFEVSLSRPY